MRRTEADGWIVKNSLRTLRLAVIPLSLGLVMASGAARAADDDRTFSEKMSDGFYGLIRGTSMDNRGIDYRERSPLVVPPSLDLPPPAANSGNAQIANWPKDPDERQRKAVIAAKKKVAPPPSRVQVSTAGGVVTQAQPINIAPPPEEGTIPNTVRPGYANERNGTARVDPVYDQPGDLFTGGAKDLLPAGVADSWDIGNIFGTKKTAAPTFAPGTEPVREALTQPPMGYQTPSPNYPYGLEAKGILSGQANPDRNPLSQRSSETSVVR